MTDKAQILALAERVEALSGPDREVDAAITRLFSDVESDDGDFWFGRYDELPARVPDFTASLDAAMTLVPKGHAFTISSIYALPEPHHAFVSDGPWLSSEDVRLKSTIVATPALALCASALRAIAEGEEG